jgi:gamma-glutamylcyclotransferase (GGCT)/AIG2-like uncharacterized protein YtfP
MGNLFTYGTLMRQEQIELLLKRFMFDRKAAILPGFRKVVSRWKYNAIVPDPQASVEGIVWGGITNTDLQILDRYERCDLTLPPYRREEHKVIIDGKEEMAWVYVGNDWLVS